MRLDMVGRSTATLILLVIFNTVQSQSHIVGDSQLPKERLLSYQVTKYKRSGYHDFFWQTLSPGMEYGDSASKFYLDSVTRGGCLSHFEQAIYICNANWWRFDRKGFYGKSSFYMNAEPGWISPTRNYFLNGKAGLVRFYDIGRVCGAKNLLYCMTDMEWA